jgi:diguanylate cyclase (GGDEF)-like protein/PAS domain S-box-containing protein
LPFKHFSAEQLIGYISEIFDQASIGITFSDPNREDNPIIYANQHFYDIYGYTPDEVIGKNCRFLQAKDRNQTELDEIRTAIKGQKAISKIIKNYKKDGSIVYNQLTISPIYDKENNLKFFLGIQKDVTQLHYSLEQVQATESLAKIGYWELDLKSNALFWSDEVFNLFEIDKAKFAATYEAFLNAIHPDDIEAVNTAYNNSLITKEPYSIQHRLLMSDGRVKYVEERCVSYFDTSGDPLRSVGTIQDITFTKEIELELQNTLSFLQSYKLALDESSIVTKSNEYGIITYANDNFCKISGYTKSEVIGKAHNIVRHPENDATLFEELWSTIKAKKVWKKIIKNRDKFGEDYWVDTTILPILNQNDEIQEYIALRYDVTTMKQQQEQLNYIANNDVLTGLGNRYKLLSDIASSNSPALAILNLDKFSHINDFYGHEAGDEIIKEFAQKLLEHRESKECHLYHLSGDEFVIFYKEITQELFMQKIALLENKLSNSKILINDDYLVFNFSLGISFEKKEKIFITADMALKIAKKSNKELVIYEDEISLNKEYQNNIKCKKTIKQAIDNDNVIPFFQAIVNNATMEWEKYESLARIETDDKIITPYFFLEISKQTRHYASITKIMIEKSFKIFQNRESEFSLNITIDDILNSEINAFIFSMLESYKIGSRVVFEIVESESIENFEAVIAFIKGVRAYGCKIAIDDFGTGYSNFVYLVKLDPDYIKIDGSLIQDICTNKTTELVVKNLVHFAQDLGMKTIAEFVENEAIFEKVKALGIDYSQGYYFSKPQREI